MEGIADYNFVRALGQGPRGGIFLAAPPARLGLQVESVAVKVLTGASHEDAFRRATRELRAFAAAKSPYLVTVFDAGQQDSSFFYSMQFCPGGSLARPATAPSRREVLLAVSQAARAAHALHEAGVVHRSIKPSNVLLHETGARLSDLGLAQALVPGQTSVSLGPVEAVEYMDPDILLGGRGSRATDTWSLGITLHRALTGSGVYGQAPPADALSSVRRVLAGKPQLSPDLLPQDAEVIARCLAPEAAARPRDAHSLAEELEALVRS